MAGVRFDRLSDHCPPQGALVLRFRSGPYLYVGLALVVIAGTIGLIFGRALFGPDAGPLSLEYWIGALVLFGLIALSLSVAISFFLRWRRATHRGAWYMSFDAQVLRLNLRQLYDIPREPLSDRIVAVIPNAAVQSIRQTTQKIRDIDEPDLHWIDVALSAADWHSLFEAYRDEFHRVGALGRDDDHHHIHFFDNHSVRVRLDRNDWQPRIEQIWRETGYPVARPYTVASTFADGGLTDAPKRVLPLATCPPKPSAL